MSELKNENGIIKSIEIHDLDKSQKMNDNSTESAKKIE